MLDALSSGGQGSRDRRVAVGMDHHRKARVVGHGHQVPQQFRLRRRVGQDAVVVEVHQA